MSPHSSSRSLRFSCSDRGRLEDNVPVRLAHMYNTRTRDWGAVHRPVVGGRHAAKGSLHLSQTPVASLRTLPGRCRVEPSVGAHRLEDVHLRGGAGRSDGGENSGHRGQSDVQVDLRTRDRDRLDPSSFSACDRASPIPVPRAAPLAAPISEITTDSKRTMARTCARVMPAARSRPSSRVRSTRASPRPVRS
ncbi:MAG: hypothetical protein JWR35_3495 [Marmoricola sp.]|nr:hypothetical protein [Marmoricola sp.]